MPYEDSYILFIDILGFRNIVTEIELNNRTEAHKLYTIKKLIHALQQEGAVANDPNLQDEASVHYSQFSDSLVISAAATPGGLLSILARARGLPMRWMRHGIFFRGALTKGPLLHENGYLLGSGFISAYDIERKVAKYPRVIVSKAVHADASKLITSLRGWIKETIITDDNDGEFFLSPFYPTEASGPDATGSAFAEEHLREAVAEINRALDENRQSPYIMGKYTWLARQMNKTQKYWYERGLIKRIFPIKL